MGAYLSTTVTSPQTIVAGALLAGDFTITSPSAGNFYLLMEQYTAALVFIPSSRAYLYRSVTGVNFVNHTVLYSTWSPAAAGVVITEPMSLLLPNSDCLLYLSLKQRASSVVAGVFVVGTTYEIMSIGTTDFTLIGATANTVGLTFVATGVGAGTGTAAELPDPDADTTVDYVVITLQSSVPAVGIDLGELMNLMITMMIVVMMMKMMKGV